MYVPILVLVLFVGLTRGNAQIEKQNDKGRKKANFKAIDNDDLYKTIKTGQYKYPVIFEPVRNIRLSISSYQVMTFIDLTPYFQYFENYKEYLNGFLEDLTDQSKMSYLARYHHRAKELEKDVSPNELEEMDCKSQMCCEGHSNLKLCQRLLFSFCMTQRQYLQITNATVHIQENFMALKTKFLGMIDYLDETLRVVTVQTDRKKRETVDGMTLETLSIEKQRIFQDLDVINEVYSHESKERNGPLIPKHLEINKEKIQIETLHEERLTEDYHGREKRNILVWAGLGWGIYSNKRQIDRIKQNIKKMQQLNILQDRKIVRGLFVLRML